MKVFGWFLVLFTFCCVPLFSQIEEIPELESETLEDNWLNQLYTELETGKHKVDLQSRTKYQETFANGLANLQFRQKDMRFNLNLYKKENSDLYANFQLSAIPSKNNPSEIHFGSFRPAFGRGTILKKSGGNSLFDINRAGHPSSFSPFGTGAILRVNNFSAFFMASGQKRNASLKEGKIGSLYKSVQSEKTSVQEEIIAGGLEYHYKNNNFALLAYNQNYDRDFADTLWVKKLNAYSISAKTTGENYVLSAETALLEENIAFQSSIKFIYNYITQELSYSYRQGKQLPAYAAKPYLLGNQGENREIDWNLDYQLSKNMSLGLRYALMRKNNALKGPNWNSRGIFNLTFNPSYTIINLQLTLLDKEIVTETDSSYIATLPVHYRLRFKIDHELNPKLTLSLLLRYHYEDKIERRNNSFYWENAFHYHRTKWQISAGIKTWQTLTSLILPETDTENPEGCICATSEDDRVFAKVTYKGKVINLKTEWQQSWLNGNRTLYLSVGL